jgi:hypothetical protein
MSAKAYGRRETRECSGTPKNFLPDKRSFLFCRDFSLKSRSESVRSNFFSKLDACLFGLKKFAIKVQRCAWLRKQSTAMRQQFWFW